MKYRITVEEITEVEDDKYPIYREVYQQTIDSLDVASLVQLINQKV